MNPKAAIDERTRYIVATHLSGDRSIAEVKTLFKKSLETAKVRPLRITSDGLQSYQEGFRKVFYSRRREDRVEYIRSPGLRGRANNNLIERFHGTVKERTKGAQSRIFGCHHSGWLCRPLQPAPRTSRAR